MHPDADAALRPGLPNGRYEATPAAAKDGRGELRLGERSIRQILAAVRDAVACYDTRGQRLWCNAAFDSVMRATSDLATIERRLSACACEVARRHRTPLADMPLPDYYPSSEFPTFTAGFAARAVYVPAEHEGGRATVMIMLAHLPSEPLERQLERAQKRYHLTPREREVMQLLLQGLHNAEVSRTLGISPHTARHHTESILDKLGVRSRAAIAALLRKW